MIDIDTNINSAAQPAHITLVAETSFSTTITCPAGRVITTYDPRIENAHLQARADIFKARLEGKIGNAELANLNNQIADLYSKYKTNYS